MAKKKKRPDYILQNGKVIRSTGASTSPKTDYVLENGKVKKTTSVSAPTKTTTTKKEKKDDILGMDFFQKGSFGDKKGNVVSDTITGVGNTGFDAGLGVVRGALSIVEGGKDLLTYGVAGLSDLVGADKFAKKAKEYAQQDDMEVMFGGIHDKVKNYSLLGDTSRSVTVGLGQIAPIILTGGLGASAGLSTVGTTALTTGVTGISSMGRGMSEAYNKDATDEEAIKYGIISGGIEAGTELLFGGLSKVGNALGVSRGIGALDDKLAKKLTQKMTNLYAKNFTEFGIKSMAEGTEELIAGVGNAFAKKITYMKEEDIKQLLQDENLLESFVVGTVTSGLTQSGYIKGIEGGSLREANKKGIDFITGYTQNEQAVFDKEVENRIKEKEKDGKTLTSKEKSKIYEQVERDIERGEIDTDTIESVLGGETLKKYKSIEEQEASLTKQLEELKQAPNTVGNAKQYETIEKQLNELKQNSNKTQLKEQLSKEVFEMTSNDARLRESYYEKARRGQDFEADLNKYDSKQREVVQKAIDSGILNNTRKTHEFVDFVAKLSVDKGIDFDFSDNERIRQRIRESGFAIGDDTVVNGFKSGNGVTINMQSGKALNTIVGHEITHVLEGTELYDSLASNVKEFAELKGIYQSMYDTAFENYKGVYEGMTEEEYKKAIEKEVTADLIGDYIFSDIDFVRNLSTKNRNVFDKVFNEIKYFLKTVNAGSDAEKQLLKAKKIFEDVYKETGNNASEDTKLSLSSIGNSFFGDPNIKSDAFTKTDENGVLEYKNTEGYKKYVDQCVNNMRQTRDDFDETVARADIEKQIDGIVDVAVASANAGFNILDTVKDAEGKNVDVRNIKDSKNRLLFSSLEPNSEYTTSSDISTICDKRLTFNEIHDDIIRREQELGVPKGKRFFDNVDNYFVLHNIMADKGLTQPCKQCYVESMRKNLTPMANAFIELVTETDENNTSNKQLYTYSKKDGYQEKTNNRKLRKRVLEELEAIGKDASYLTDEMLSTSDGLAQLRLQAPMVYEAFNSFYGQSKPKMPKQATPFRFGELTALLTDNNGNVNKRLIKQINDTGGFRLQSYSDFQIKNFTDVLQVIFEAGTLGLNGHAYTKVPAFLDATKGTNLKRNISIFMYKDGNEWKIDKNDSFPYELEEIYEIVNADKSGNTSIIAVSQNAEMSAWIMANDMVGYGIPFHKSGLKMGTVRNTDVKTDDKRIVKGYKGIKDHTKQQTEVWKNTVKDENGEIKHKANTKVKKAIDIYEFWDFENKGNLSKNELIRINLEAYIDACEEQGYRPKFREYLMDNGKVLNDTLRFAKELGYASQDATIDDISFQYGEYRIPYGYYKFLGDFGMFKPNGDASPQQTLSLKNYAFGNATDFFKDAETLRRNEILQQFANGVEREEMRSSGMSTEELQKELDKRKQSVVDEVIAPVQFSISQDTKGRTLTKEQQEFFKDSVVRDENGNLKTLYHGTTSEIFTEFNMENGVWLSTDYEYAKEYSGWWNTNFYSEGEGLGKDVYADNNLRIYEMYADIKKPFELREINHTLSDAKVNQLSHQLGWYVADKTGDKKQGGAVSREVRELAKDYIGEKTYQFTRTKDFIELLKKYGFDGFVATEDGTKTYCAFNSTDQVKLVTNTQPTSNADIRYSISKENQDIAPNPNGIYSKDVLKEGIAPIGEQVVDSNNMMEEEMFAPPDENFVVDNDVAPISKEYEVIVPERTKNKPRMVRVKDTTNASQQSPKTKQRRWIDTSTQSDVINQEILPEDLEQAKINYEPIPNKKTLDQANADLDRMGYDKALSVFKAKMETRTLSLSDIALGERLVQESMKRGDRATTGELIQDIAILGTELGQKVQALSIIQRLTPEGQLGMLQKVVNRGKAKGDITFDGVTITQEMIDKILSVYNKDGTYDQNKLNEAVEDVKKDIAKQMKVTTMDKVNAWRYLSMLGNPKTHIRNLVSNLSMMATSEVKNALSRTIEGASNIENRTRTWEKGTDVVKEFAKTSTEEAKGILTDGNSYSEAADIKSKRDIFKTKILQKAYDFNSDLLTKEDWWFKKSAYRRSLEEFLTANGIKTQEDIKKNPKLIEKAKNYAIEQSQIATFQQYSWLANKIGEIERKNVATQIGVGAVLPFKKTPVNIAKTGLAYSPLGFAKTLTYDLHQMKQGKMEASQVIDNLAKNTTGTALTFIGYMLAMSGLLNGGGDDDKEGKYDYQLGEQSYSLNFNGNTYSLNWLTPVAMPLFVGANAYEMWQEGQELTFDTTSQALAQTLDPLSEMSFLSSLDSILTSYESGMGKFAGIGTTAIQSYASQFIPTLSSQVASTIDDTKRSTKVSGDSTFKIGEETLNSLLYKIPFLRETLEPSTDIWGNEVKQNEKLLGRAFESFIAPYSRKENIATKIDQELKDLYAETGDNNVLPNIPYNYVNFKGEKYKMSAREHTDFKKTYGTTANDLLEELFATTTYKNSTSDERAELVDNVFDYASEEAKKEYLGKEGVEFTNAKKDGEEYYKENNVKGAIENDMSLDEFKLFNDNPEKYKIMQENNIDFKEYSSLDEDTKEIYDKALNWAKENPEKYKISRVITSSVIEYRDYMKDLDDFRADKDANGKSISGSSKAKKEAYIQSLSLDAGQKMILHRSLFDSKEDKSKYNRAIIEYLDSRDDISYEEMVTILEELDMKVHSDGRVTW